MNPNTLFLALDSSTAQHMVLRLSTPKGDFDSPTKIEHLESALIPAIDELLQKASYTIKDIDAFVLGAGPGSFMGLRLGFSVFRTWAWVLDKPITTLSSLELLRQSYFSTSQTQDLYVPCIDGKMQRVFAHIYGNNQLLLEDGDFFPKDLAQKILLLYKLYKKKNFNSIIIFGSGAEILKGVLPQVPHIHYYDYTINHNCFHRNILLSIPQERFSQKSLDYLAPIEPSYLRVSAAEMTLLEKKEKKKES